MSIRGHLPPKGRDGYVNIQVKMETSIVEEVRVCMKADGVSWNELLTACFRAYLEESKKAILTDTVEDGLGKTKVISTLVCITAFAGLIDNPLLQIVSDYVV